MIELNRMAKKKLTEKEKQDLAVALNKFNGDLSSLLAFFKDIPEPNTNIDSLSKEIQNLIEENKKLKRSNQDLEKLIYRKNIKSGDNYVVTEEIAKIGSWSWNLDKDKIWISKGLRKMLGIAPEEVFDYLGLCTLFSPKNPEKIIQLFNTSLEKHETFEVTQKIRVHNKNKSFVLKAEPVLNGKGKVLKFYGALKDVTKIIEKEDRLLKEQKKLSKELFQANLYLKSVFNSSIDGFITTDLKGNILSINERTGDVFRVNTLNIESKNFTSLCRTGEEAKWESAFEFCIANKRPKQIFYTFKSRGLKQRSLQITFSPIESQKGKLEGVLIVAKDNTELESAKSLLKQSEKAFTTIADNMNEAVLMVNNDDRIFYVNNNLKRLTGYTDADLLGEVAKEVLLYKEDHDRMNKIIALRAAGAGSSYEIRLRKKNGRALWVNVSGAPIYDHNNNIIGSVGIHKDVSELRKHRKQLEDMARFPRENPNPVLRFGPRGKIMYFNDKAKEMLPFFLKDDETVEKERKFLMEVYNGQKVRVREIKVKDKTYNLVYSPVNPGYINVYGLDISDLKEVNKKLELARNQAVREARAKELFLANMSHEIRTPMNGIMGVIQMLRGTKLTKTQVSYLETMDFSAKNLLTIINDILDLSKIEAGKFKIEKVTFDLKSTVKNTIDNYSVIAKQKGLKIATKNVDKLPTSVNGDPVRLSQILSNLISNAIKFTDEGGTVRINCYAEKKVTNKVNFKFEVEDDGIGISKENISKIFKNFEQAHIESKRVTGGTGLGLSIVKKLIELQKGEIKVESEFGKGTKFEVYLSYELMKGTTPEIILPDHNSPEPDALKDLKVLLVEDNKINQMVARSFLEEYGANITLAENGKEAIEWHEKENFDIMLLDLQMPIMDGYETLKYLKRKEVKRILVVAMTAHALKTEEEKCRKLGVADYLTKPLKKEFLVNRINQLLNGND